jgi:hypothetical protein
MFTKYASNLLQGIYEECMLKALSCKNKQKAQDYYNIAERIDKIINDLLK